MDNFKWKFRFGKLGQGSLDEFENFKSKNFFLKVVTIHKARAYI